MTLASTENIRTVSELGLCPIPNPLLFIHIGREALILAIALREWGEGVDFSSIFGNDAEHNTIRLQLFPSSKELEFDLV